MSVDIIVVKRSDDYQAHLADNTAIWECGKSEAEAIGKLVMSARETLGITILRTPKTKHATKG